MQDIQALNNSNLEDLKDSSVNYFSASNNQEFKSLEDFVKFSESVDTYYEIFKLSKVFRNKVVFSCMDLKDQDVHSACQSSPENLNNLFKDYSRQFKIPIIAENTEVLTSESIDYKLQVIQENIKGFYEFNYMRMKDADISNSFERNLNSELVGLMDQNDSKNYFRKRKIILIETIECSKCLNDLLNFKKDLNLI